MQDAKVLCEGLNEEFAKYLEHARSLTFEEKPKYENMRNLFRGLMEKKGYEYDYEYDWVVKEKAKKG